MRASLNPFLLLLLALLLSACGSGQPSSAQTVEQYLQAKVKGDRDTISRLLCLEMEPVLEAEAASFSSVSDVKIEGMACQNDGDNLVRCQGKIIASYGEEQTEFQLSSYRVVEEDGQWKWCGEGN